MGSVSRPLEQLMFSESPRRRSGSSRIIRELLDTPPDPSDVQTKVGHGSTGSTGSRVCAAKAVGAVKDQTPKVPKSTEPIGDPKICHQIARGRQSVLSSMDARGRAIWFLQTPGPNEKDIDISRLPADEEAAMNTALETAPSSAFLMNPTWEACDKFKI